MNKTNWITTYGDSKVQKLQGGGEMVPPPEAGATPAEQGPDLEGMIAEYAQTRDPQLAVAIVDMLVEMMAQQQGGAPAGGAPAGPEAGAPPAGPMGKQGMKMSAAPIF